MKKRLLAVALSFVMAVMPVTSMNNGNVNAASTETVNLALNATVTTSSNESNDYLGKYAVDGNSATRWSSSFNNGEWIMVDLGSICTVGCVNIEWEAAYASNYSIYWSQDNVTWNLALTKGISSAAKTTDMFYNRPVRYIKVVCNTRATAYGSSIFELEVMGYKTEAETTTEAPTTTVAPTTEAPTTAASTVTNLALGKAVTASSVENNDYAAAYAVDGNSATRWSSTWNDGEWIMVDLGAIYTVGCVNIDWEAAYASNYSIYWSQDNATWNLALTKGISSAAKTTDMFYNRPVRYIKVVCNSRATTYGSSIFELEVMGYNTVTETTTEAPTTTVAPTTEAPTTEEVISSTTNLALNKTVVSSSNENNDYAAAYAVDGNPATRWSSAWKDGEWIMVDLGKLYNVGSVAIDWEAAYASEYTISWSQDNVTWNDAVIFSPGRAGEQNHMFYNRPVRYIKITANKRATTYGASIFEIGVYGSTYNPNYTYTK